MNCSNILPVGILLLILICSEFSLVKAEDPPLADIRSHITPGELLIRLTPEAAADVEQLHANAPIFLLHAKHNVEIAASTISISRASIAQSKFKAYLPVTVFS